MIAQKGHYIALSAARKTIWDLMNASQKIPLVSVMRHMNLRELMHARATAQPRPSWNSIFTKAHARVAAEVPELRRLFVRWPWGRLYEHAQNLAAIAVEADIDNEKVIVPGRVTQPEKMDLASIDRQVRDLKHDPNRSKWHRRSAILAHLPRPLRRLLWWLALDWSGPRRARTLGTFAVTSVAFAGADAVTILTPVAHVLHYGPLDTAGNIRVLIVFDHRIMDGALPARALVRLEEVLNTDILAEVRGLQLQAAA
jgi:pyruvate/2-oxoglutarate dehydrogenase complex dihydrolipoamide acyltransferase (E2) component